MSDLSKLQQRIVQFRDERDWKQFHNPKDLSISLLLEAAEVLEHFQWKTIEEQQKHIREQKQEVSEELADTLYWVLLLAHDLGIDLVKAMEAKMAKNEAKYPVEKSRGNHKKYTELI
jgi:dCTP diphosphatase